MTYDQALQWLYDTAPALRNYEKVGVDALRETYTLYNIRTICRHLGSPHTSYPTIHVAGTNGKGSVCHATASILQSCGYRVGLYTSPHMMDFRERIKVGKEWISQESVLTFVQKYREWIEEYSFSFFEIVVAMAFFYFKEQKVDIAVIETGLGGRLDSTNVVEPLVSAITSIDYEHQKVLGDTLEQITYEKAGIIKPHTPVVVGQLPHSCMQVVHEVANERGAEVINSAERAGLASISTDLGGAYQQHNLKISVAIAKILKKKGWDITAKGISHGLTNVVPNTGLRGRYECISQSPEIICDIAHTPEALSLLISQVRENSYGRLHFVMGFVRDKDIIALLRSISIEATYHFAPIDVAFRAVPNEDIASVAQQLGIDYSTYPSMPQAYEGCVSQATPTDKVVVCGSVFAVSEVLRYAE